MAFVKLDCGILNSTLWVEREPRDVFITALLMATPFEVVKPMAQLKVNAIEETGFVVPPGWYGFVEAAGPGIVRRAIADPVLGLDALARLGDPDPESRSSDFEGRRLVRVDGGYIILNYMKYREKDNTAAVRAQRYRERKKIAASNSSESQRDDTIVTRDTSCGVTKADAEGEEEKEISLLPTVVGSGVAQNATPATPPPDFDGTNAEKLNGKALVRVAAEWELPSDWGGDAEALGFKPGEVLREAERFRQYWVAGKGQGTRRTVRGWRQSWSNWLGKAAQEKR